MLFLLALIFCLIATPLAIAGMLTPAFFICYICFSILLLLWKASDY
jgi:hypothetical protein